MTRDLNGSCIACLLQLHAGSLGLGAKFCSTILIRISRQMASLILQNHKDQTLSMASAKEYDAPYSLVNEASNHPQGESSAVSLGQRWQWRLSLSLPNAKNKIYEVHADTKCVFLLEINTKE